jgi:hypothetical protein
MSGKSKIFFPKKLFWKNSIILICWILVSNFRSQFLYAQQISNTASASISATIVNPIGITKKVDLSFGNLYAGTSSGTVILDPAGNRSATGGVTLPSAAGTVTAASFDVTGEDSYSYTITLPTTAYITSVNSGSETMLINNFISSPSQTGKLNSGIQTISVGATLNVGAVQPPSEYKNDKGFVVIVNYN